MGCGHNKYKTLLIWGESFEKEKSYILSELKKDENLRLAYAPAINEKEDFQEIIHDRFKAFPNAQENETLLKSIFFMFQFEAVQYFTDNLNEIIKSVAKIEWGDTKSKFSIIHL